MDMTNLRLHDSGCDDEQGEEGTQNESWKSVCLSKSKNADWKQVEVDSSDLSDQKSDESDENR
jgi:hypothetical protein